MADASKCPRCKGWAFEPDTYPMANCTNCDGTGRKPGVAAPEANADLPEARG